MKKVTTRVKEPRAEIEKIFGDACAHQIKVAIKKSTYSYDDVLEKLRDELGYEINPSTFKSALSTGSIRASLYEMILLVIDEKVDQNEIIKYIRVRHDIDVNNKFTKR